MASFFEAEVYFASVSEQFFGRFPRLSEKISVFLESLNTPERFLEYRFEGRQIQRLLEAKFAIVLLASLYHWIPSFFQLSALDIWISDFVQHWILNTEFLLQYLAAHVISALHLGVRFLLGNFLEWIFLVRLER
ncbi:hypothetical protein GLOIN_2v1489076 [Rhizophagus irregularis DAOM 181602=DAOM 197198]|nr:hypothetical protein GLOIN_2v1489076 [Rhizophagus irregularis DAOM 181602=DAOM 197198]